jgi:hypothetical protein
MICLVTAWWKTRHGSVLAFTSGGWLRPSPVKGELLEISENIHIKSNVFLAASQVPEYSILFAGDPEVSLSEDWRR